jgi:GAF domain-containing protein
VRPTAASLLRNLLASDPDAFAHAFNACIARTGQAVFVPNVSSELMRLWTHPGSWPYLKRFEVSTVLAAPLRTRDRVIGTLLLWRERPGPMFTELDLSFATQVADRLAPGLADLRQPTSGAQVVRPRAADRRLQSHPSAR